MKLGIELDLAVHDGKLFHEFKLSTPYSDPERHNAERHRQTDRQTDDSVMPIAGHTVYDRLIKPTLHGGHTRHLASHIFGGGGKQENFLGRVNNFRGTFLCYYAYRKTMAVKVVFLAFVRLGKYIFLGGQTSLDHTKINSCSCLLGTL